MKTYVIISNTFKWIFKTALIIFLWVKLESLVLVMNDIDIEWHVDADLKKWSPCIWSQKPEPKYQSSQVLLNWKWFRVVICSNKGDITWPYCGIAFKSLSIFLIGLFLIIYFLIFAKMRDMSLHFIDVTCYCFDNLIWFDLVWRTLWRHQQRPTR